MRVENLHGILRGGQINGDDDDETLEKPTTEKKLFAATDENGNKDGTYTISLSVKGTAKSNTESTKAYADDAKQCVYTQVHKHSPPYNVFRLKPVCKVCKIHRKD